MENLIQNKDPDVYFFKHNKYTGSKLGKLKKYMYYVLHNKYHEKGRKGVLRGRPSQFVYCRLCQKVMEEDSVSEHECVKAISGIITIYENEKSRVTIVGEENVNALYLFIHPVKLDNCLTDLAYCDKCKSFFPKAIVVKSDYDHKCLGSDGWSDKEKARRKGMWQGGFKSSNLKYLPDTGYKSLQCKLCKEKFKSAEPAEFHMRIVHGEGEKRVLCSHCGKGFETILRARRHEISQHGTKDGIKVPSKEDYQCTECGKKFKGKAQVKAHMLRIHSNARSWICEQCGKGFKTKEEVKTHMKTHGEKTVQCDLCELKFRNKANLRKHRMRHTGERPNVCPYCQHGCIQIGECKRHIRKVHGIVVPKGMSMKAFCDSLTSNPDQYGQPRR